MKKSTKLASKKSKGRATAKAEWAVVFDTETTGLVKSRLIKLDKQPEVIEFFACLVDLKSGKIDRELDLLIRPTVEYPMSVYTIKETKTKLSNDMLYDAPTFKEVAKQIREFLEGAPRLIAHNITFDKEMIEIEHERLQQTITWPLRLDCTVEQTIHLKGHRLSLTALHTLLFDEGFEDAHRARHDVMALTRCAVELQKRGML